MRLPTCTVSGPLVASFGTHAVISESLQLCILAEKLLAKKFTVLRN
jgi:hypothetical protein